LTVTDVRIVQGIGLQNITEHLLALSTLLLEHVDLGECTSEITLDDAFVR